MAWTILALCALAWLLKSDVGPSILIIDAGEAARPDTHKDMQGWFKSEIGFAHLCPWLMLGPYVAFLALRFPLERGQLKLGLPVNLAACIAFVLGSHAISSQSVFNRGKVVIFGPLSGSESSATNHFNLTNREMVNRRIIRNSGSTGLLISRSLTNFSGSTETNLRNLLSELQLGSKFAPPDPPQYSFWASLVDLLAYGAIVGLSHSVHFYRRFREREHRALALESSLTRSQLNALKAQLQPHFLFNSLNAIVALLRRDPALAEATLVSLSELLRLALSNSERQEINLREELEFVNRYVDIQRTRFGDKLRFEQDIEPGALEALTPALLLQPLVENAIRHGIEPSDQPGILHLSARQSGDRLALVVEDNGIGFSEANSSFRVSPDGTGTGLKNLRKRLETLYGTNQKLEVVSNPKGGVIVRVEIPWQIPASIKTADAMTES